MYLPPPGRPISSPPFDNQNETTTKRRYRHWSDKDKARIKAEFLAGTSAAVLCERYQLGRGGLSKILTSQGVVRRPNAIKANKPAKPVRQDGESHWEYAARIRHWKCETDPEYAKAVQEKRVASFKATMRKRRLAKARAEREAIERAERMRNIFSAEPEPPMPVAPPPPPTLWQRIVGWFR